MDKEALTASVAKAAKKKIPVLIFDSALKGTPGKDFISIVGIDNRKAGKIAGEQLIKLLGGKGKVVMLRVVVGQSNITNREEGFLDAIAKYKGIRLIEKNLFGAARRKKLKKYDELINLKKLTVSSAPMNNRLWACCLLCEI